MKSLSKNLVWVLVTLLLLSAIYSVIVGQFQTKKELSLTDLVARINKGEIKEIAVVDSTLEILSKSEGEMYNLKN